MKMMNPRLHGTMDYLFGLLLLVAPGLLGFSDTASTICYSVALIHLTMSVLTNYPYGIVKLIPFPVHGTIELVLAVTLLLMPWMAGFTEDVVGRNFFIFGGVALFGVWATTDYRALPKVESVISDDFTYRRTG